MAYYVSGSGVNNSGAMHYWLFLYIVGLHPKYGFSTDDSLFVHGLTLGLVLIAITIMMRTYIADLADAERRARDASHRSEQLLRSMLPPSIVDSVRRHGTTFTQQVDAFTVLFTEIMGFTPWPRACLLKNLWRC
jgi:hypothetical protein